MRGDAEDVDAPAGDFHDEQHVAEAGRGAGTDRHREPITEATRGAAYDGPAISEEEHEVTLHTERPVVDTEAVPVERVRLGKETVTDQQTVGGEVRKEEIELDTSDTSIRDNPRR
jgi:stress response protein YsnF